MELIVRDLFNHALTVNATRNAIESEERVLTFAEVDTWATQVARQLQDLGVRQGDTVAIYLHNCPEFLVVDVAIARLGAVKLPVNFMLPVETVSYILEIADAKVVVVDERLRSGLDDAVQSRERPPAVLQIPGPCRQPFPGVQWLEECPSERVEPLEYDRHAVTPDDPAAIYFTGGTTGRPKGVVHSQRSTSTFHYAQMLEAEIHEDERLLLMTPMAHAAGLFAQTALARGATSVIRDGFDAALAVELFRSADITWTFLVPTMIYRIIDQLDEPTAGSTIKLRTVVYGAAPIAAVQLERALAIFGSVFIQLYGQTECPNWGTRLAKSDHDPANPQLLASCGRPSIMTRVKIVDDEGRDVPVGTAGEICLASPYVLDRYLGDADATAEKFLGSWIRTGDIGLLDEQGYLYLKDRKNDMVISGGMNVYCREVEEVLEQHPDVKAVAVIGIPHPDWGEAVHAVVVANVEDFAVPDVIEWTRGRLASYARPKSIELVDALPETTYGKIDKASLRSKYWDDQARAIG
jgi:fatty-acyl-CoA synthase